MKDVSLNYTPLHTPNKFNIKSFMGSNILALVVGLSIISYMYFNNKIATEKQTSSIQASENSTICEENPLSNPNNITVTSATMEREINIGEIVDIDSITFEWELVENAEFYYIYLHEEARKLNEIIDPASLGVIANENKYTFEDLKSNQTYYLYIRSKGYDQSLGMVYPTPDNCNIFIPSKPIFYFKTEI